MSILNLERILYFFFTVSLTLSAVIPPNKESSSIAYYTISSSHINSPPNSASLSHNEFNLVADPSSLKIFLVPSKLKFAKSSFITHFFSVPSQDNDVPVLGTSPKLGNFFINLDSSLGMIGGYPLSTHGSAQNPQQINKINGKHQLLWNIKQNTLKIGSKSLLYACSSPSIASTTYSLFGSSLVYQITDHITDWTCRTIHLLSKQIDPPAMASLPFPDPVNQFPSGGSHSLPTHVPNLMNSAKNSPAATTPIPSSYHKLPREFNPHKTKLFSSSSKYVPFSTPTYAPSSTSTHAQHSTSTHVQHSTSTYAQPSISIKTSTISYPTIHSEIKPQNKLHSLPTSSVYSPSARPNSVFHHAPKEGHNGARGKGSEVPDLVHNPENSTFPPIRPVILYPQVPMEARNGVRLDGTQAKYFVHNTKSQTAPPIRPVMLYPQVPMEARNGVRLDGTQAKYFVHKTVNLTFPAVPRKPGPDSQGSNRLYPVIPEELRYGVKLKDNLDTGSMASDKYPSIPPQISSSIPPQVSPSTPPQVSPSISSDKLSSISSDDDQTSCLSCNSSSRARLSSFGGLWKKVNHFLVGNYTSPQTSPAKADDKISRLELYRSIKEKSPQEAYKILRSQSFSATQRKPRYSTSNRDDSVSPARVSLNNDIFHDLVLSNPSRTSTMGRPDSGYGSFRSSKHSYFSRNSKSSSSQRSTSSRFTHSISHDPTSTLFPVAPGFFALENVCANT